MESILEYFSPTLESVEITSLQEYSNNEIIGKKDIPVFIFHMINEQYKWTVAKSYNDLLKFHKKFKKRVTKQLEIPKKSEFLTMNQSEKISTLENFFSELLRDEEICRNAFLQEFLEVSYLSFRGTTTKFKEGYVKKQTRGRKGNDKKSCSCGKYFKRFQKRWMLVRETGIVLSNDKSTINLSDNLFFDSKFSIVFSKETKYEDGILINTSKRELLLRTGDLVALASWKKSIEEALKNAEYSERNKRFNSLYPIRTWNKVKIFVDGENYFRKVYQKLKTAKNQVFITDWWLSPELYLKRPAAKHPKSMLFTVLKKLADKGVSIYVHVFNEISQALTLNSKYTVRKLREHPQIRAIRHPKRPLNDMQLLWSHHEKVVCIDQEIAFLGGLDLCYGRMDNQKHKLKDQGSKPYWNGIDYSNSRIQDFDSNVGNWEADRLDRNKVPRMPWHDVGVMIRGDAAYDVSVNYIELWNHVMTDSSGGYVKNKDILIPLKAKPRIKKSMVSAGNSEINKSKDIDVKALDEIETDREEIENYRKESQKKLLEKKTLGISVNEEIKKQEYEIRGSFFRSGAEGTCECQVVRSAGGWSYGLDTTDHSIYTAYLSLIDDAEHFIYIENQFFISSTAGKPVNNIAQALVDKIIAMARKNLPFKVIVVIPLLPGFAGDVGPNSGNVVKIQLHWEYLTISRGPNSIYKQLENAPEIKNPMDYIQFYGLRTHDILNNTPVTEIVYIHSKLMVIDDEYMIIGSANINDRSMIGEHDSEIAVVIKDKNKVEIQIDGITKKVSKAVHDFRMSVFKEFVGDCRDKDIEDPLSVNFIKEWEGTAESNTLKYRALFMCYPDDEMISFDAMTRLKETALVKVSENINGEQADAIVKRYNKEKKDIKGFLVQFPLRFLENEELKPSGLALENLLPEKGFL
ncbi:hypothetical protein SteCoe_11254 [Stentor coeruleus]|uniref:Phospholipase n=1 Tax=Stentor coeruleus TaxID=5963 RepID=A0A1R2CDL0_9CILI|nr:hypothetical protein SteCoe_11254 [Stentor coeruleus]